MAVFERRKVCEFTSVTEHFLLTGKIVATTQQFFSLFFVLRDLLAQLRCTPFPSLMDEYNIPHDRLQTLTLLDPKCTGIDITNKLVTSANLLEDNGHHLMFCSRQRCFQDYDQNSLDLSTLTKEEYKQWQEESKQHFNCGTKTTIKDGPIFRPFSLFS